MDILYHFSLWISIVGIIVMTWGVTLSTIDFFRMEYYSLRKFNDGLTNFKSSDLRRKLGSYILLGLEFMIAGDIIHTVLRPDRESLIVLGSIVAIRTVISYFLQKELKSEI